jgi:hypothetical protein
MDIKKTESNNEPSLKKQKLEKLSNDHQNEINTLEDSVTFIN